MSGTEYKQPLVFAVAELTNRCNLRCPHCASGSGRARKGELRLDQWQTIFADLRKLGCAELTLLGGEIFLRKDWFAVAQSAVDTGLNLAIVTNGLLVKDTIEEQLSSLPLVRLGVSLDGASPEVYRAVRGVDGFERVWRFIRETHERGHTPVNAITTFSQTNADNVDQLIELFEKTSITWQVQIAGRVSPRFDARHFLSREQFQRICRKLGTLALTRSDRLVLMDDMGYFPLEPELAPAFDWWSGCAAGRSVIGIRSNGDVLGCLSLGDPFIEGRLVNGEGLERLWRSSGSFWRMRHKDTLLRGPCKTCPEAARCCAGCAALAYSATGDIGDNPYCLRRIECESIIHDLGL